MPRVGIIGAGELGQALSFVLSAKNIETIFWDKNPNLLGGQLNISESLAEVVEAKDFVFYCLPAGAVREALAISAPYFKTKQTAVFFSKGLDPQTGKLAFELGSKILPSRTPLAVLSGAMIAEELLANHLGVALVAGTSNKAALLVQELFTETKLLIKTNDSLPLLAWAGVLKNVYALGLGFLVGRGALKNEQAYYFARASQEIKFLLKSLTGQNSFFDEAELVADFWATATSIDSANYRYGLLLGQGQKPEHFCEAEASWPALRERLGRDLSKCPLLSEIDQYLKRKRI